MEGLRWNVSIQESPALVHNCVKRRTKHAFLTAHHHAWNPTVDVAHCTGSRLHVPGLQFQ